MLDKIKAFGICPHCDEKVMEWEVHEYYMNDPRAYHMECFARPILGSVAHIEKRCSCFIPGASEGDDPALTKRQAALASVEANRRVTLVAAHIEMATARAKCSMTCAGIEPCEKTACPRRWT